MADTNGEQGEGALEALPPTARRFAIEVVDERRRLAASLSSARETDRRFAGDGRYEYELVTGVAFGNRLAASMRSESVFRRAAERGGVDADAIFDALGGLGSLRPSEVALEWTRPSDPRPWEPPEERAL